jgi:hypothetical protein
MEFFRVGHDVWGQRVLEGVSWDLLPVAAGIGAAVIVGHLIYKLIRGGKGGA